MINVTPIYIKFVIYVIAGFYAVDFLVHWNKSIFNMEYITDPDHIKFVSKYGKAIDAGIRIFVIIGIGFLLPMQLKVALDIPYVIQGKYIVSKVIILEDVIDEGNESEHKVKVKDIVTGKEFTIIVSTTSLNSGDRFVIRYLPNSKYAVATSVY